MMNLRTARSFRIDNVKAKKAAKLIAAVASVGFAQSLMGPSTFGPQLAKAAQLTWGTNGTGGTGTWSTTTANWFDGTNNVLWADGSVANFPAGATATVTMNSPFTVGGMLFTNASNAYTISNGNIATNTLTLGNGATLTGPTATSKNVTFNVVVTGGDVTLVNNNLVADVFAFGATNTFTGNVNLTGSAAATASSQRLAANFNVVGALPSTATINYARTQSQVGFNGAFNYGNVPNNFVLNSTNNTSGTFTSWIGAVAGATVTLNGLISGSSGLTFGVGLSGGAGIITLNNNMTYTGDTSVLVAPTGVIKLGVNNALPVTTNLSFGTGNTSAGSLDMNGKNQTVASLSGTGAGQLNGLTNTQAGLSTLTINGSSNTTYAGRIGTAFNTSNVLGSNSNIALVLANTNTGSLTLTSANNGPSDFSGGVTINGGALYVGNTTSSATGSSAITVASAGKFGSASAGGLANGHVTSSGTILPGTSGAVGTLNLAGGVTLNANSNVNLDFGAGNDQITVGGPDEATALSTPGGSQSVNLNLFDLGNGFNNTTYTVINYPAGLFTVNDPSTAFKVVKPLTGTAANATFSLANNSGSNRIELTVSGVGTNISWSGGPTGSGTWDVATTSNFNGGGGPNTTTFHNGDVVTFDDAGNSGDDPVVVSIAAGGVAPGNTIVNGTRNYTFQGGPITLGGFSDNSRGVVILSGTNSYAGGTTVGAGSTLAITNDLALGAVPTTPTINLTIAKTGSGTNALTGALRFDADMSLNANRTVLLTQSSGNGPDIDTNNHSATIAGNITGGSSGVNLIKVGGGTLTLTGDNSTNVGGGFVGAMFINQGTLNVTSDASMGKANGTLHIADPTVASTLSPVLQFGASFNMTRGLSIDGDPNGGDVIDTQGFNPTISGAIVNSNNNPNFTKVGSGTLTLSGANTYSNTMMISGGTVLAGAANTLSSNANHVIGASATMDLGGFNQTVGSLAGSGTLALSASLTHGAKNDASTVFSGTVTGTGALTKVGNGTFELSGTSNNFGTLGVGGGTVSVTGNSTVRNINQTAGTLAVNGSGYLHVAASGRLPSSTSILAGAPVIDPGAQLDIEDNAVVVQYDASDTTHSARDTIRNLLKNGRNGGAGAPGAWNGHGGITSSFAHNNGNGFNLAIGYGDNTDLAAVRASGSYTAFGGQTVASNTVLVQMTRGADATLDGVVDSQDVTIIGTHFNKPGSGQWCFGDFDYSGTCDSTDVTTLGTTFGKTSPTLSPAQMTAEFGSAFTSAFEAGASGAGSVPEPASLTLIGLGGLALMGRRRSKRLGGASR